MSRLFYLAREYSSLPRRRLMSNREVSEMRSPVKTSNQIKSLMPAPLKAPLSLSFVQATGPLEGSDSVLHRRNGTWGSAICDDVMSVDVN
jgi:hypothetical protein